jgi:glucose/arabinose dehydrogenase
VVNDSFPTDRHHGWKFIRFGPDGLLYVPVGAPCNVCDKSSANTQYASIMRMKPDGSELELFASGVRNTVGFDWHPITNELWFTDNGRDMMGDDIPPDELNHAPRAGMHCRRSHYFPIFCLDYFHSFSSERKGHAPTAEVALT